MIKGTGDAVKAVKDNPSQSIVIALAVALLGGSTGVGGSIFAENRSSGAHDKEVAGLQREFDQHVRNYQRAMDRRDREFAEYRQLVRLTLITGDNSFLMDSFSPPPAAAAIEAFEEEFEDEAEDAPDTE